MKGMDNNWKKNSDLTLADFGMHPVWAWVEDDMDESLVMPVDCSQVLPSDDEYTSLFVASEFLLSDGTVVPGAVSVKMADSRSERWVYGLDLAGANGRLFAFPLHPLLEGLVSRERLAAWLSKPLQAVFPLTYHTSYMFSDGQPLAGRIE